MADHVVRDVRMHVEADRNRQVGTKPCTDATQQFPFAVIVACGDHRAMEIKIQAIEGRGLAEDFEDACRDRLERVVGDRTGRLCCAPKNGMEIDPCGRPRRLDESAIGRLRPSVSSRTASPSRRAGHESAISNSGMPAVP